MNLLAKLFGVGAKKPPLSVDDSNFLKEITNSPVPVILDVWGSRCAPCKQLEPVIMELAATYDGRVKVCEMNAELAPRSCVQLKVRSTPTVIYFRGGREVDRVSGFRSSLYHHQTVEELFQIKQKA